MEIFITKPSEDSTPSEKLALATAGMTWITPKKLKFTWGKQPGRETVNMRQKNSVRGSKLLKAIGIFLNFNSGFITTIFVYLVE